MKFLIEKIFRNPSLNINSGLKGGIGLIDKHFKRQVCTHPTLPVNVLVTGAGGQIGYSLLPRLARGDVWGPKKPINLKMLDIPSAEKIMQGVRMELEDCAFSTLKDIQIYTDPIKAFSEAHVVVMLANAMVLTHDIPRSQLLKENLKIYSETVNAIKKSSSQDTKVLVIANPANTLCVYLIESLKYVIKPQNLTCLTRLDHNRTKAMLAKKLGVPNNYVRRVIVWGNHSHSMYPDLRFAQVLTDKGWVDALKHLNDPTWVKDVLVPAVRNRAYDIIVNRNKSSSLSAANAGIDHLKDIFLSTEPDDWVSMGIYSDGKAYNQIPKGIVFGQPCICKNGKYQVVQDLPIDDYTKKMIEHSVRELKQERDIVLPH